LIIQYNLGPHWTSNGAASLTCLVKSITKRRPILLKSKPPISGSLIGDEMSDRLGATLPKVNLDWLALFAFSSVFLSISTI